MSAEKESFVFYRSFFEALQDLKDKERLQMYDAICNLALNEQDTELKGITKTMFTLIKPQILSNTKKYKDGQKGAEYGKLGGRPKKEKTPVGLLEKTPNVNENVNENVNDNENVNANVNVSDSCVDGLQKIFGFYENNITLLTPYSAELLTDFYENMGQELVLLAMQKAVEANKRTIQYVKGILNNWSKKGIKTVIEAKEEDQKYKNSNVPKEETEEEQKQRKIKELEEAMKNDNS